jgi:hypothetical protein
MNRCLNCSSTFVRPVRPAWWQWLRLRFTSLRPHECWHCGWRGWLPLEDPYERDADARPKGGAERRLHDRRRPEDASSGDGEPTPSTPRQTSLR